MFESDGSILHKQNSITLNSKSSSGVAKAAFFSYLFRQLQFVNNRT